MCFDSHSIIEFSDSCFCSTFCRRWKWDLGRSENFLSWRPYCATCFLPKFAKLEKAMAPHSSTLAWKIPWMEEPGWLQSMGLLGVRHDWATSLSLFTFMHWRRKWQLTPVFLPGESQGRGSLVGCHLWGLTESDMTNATKQQQQQQRQKRALSADRYCWAS